MVRLLRMNSVFYREVMHTVLTTPMGIVVVGVQRALAVDLVIHRKQVTAGWTI